MDLTDQQGTIIEPLFEAKRRPDGRGRPWRDARAVSARSVIHGSLLDGGRLSSGTTALQVLSASMNSSAGGVVSSSKINDSATEASSTQSVTPDPLRSAHGW